MNKKATASRLPSKIAKPISSRQSSRANSPTPSESGALTEYTDDFIVGDRVWVGGTKPGYIQFIGETKFAPGEWAGVVLDEAVGKNDGTVGGVRYFMCEPKRGVFSRLSKLTRDSVGSSIRTSPKPSITSDNEEIQSRRVSSPTNGSVSTSSTRRAVSPTDGVTRLTKQTKRVSASPNTGGQVLTTTTTTTVKHDAVPAASGHVKIGDRVLVGGTKAGVLRYVGTTDFAPGNWCGVELDEPLGKNDGTVAGKKYFDCKMKYGLFAPTHKVTKQPGSSTVTRVVRTTRVAANSPTSSLHKRSGSRESLASMSTTSQRSTPGSRVRLGVTSLTSPSQKSGRPQAANVSATNTALQETLREKEQHIDQLLKERDMDRSEVARAAAQVDAVESQLAALQSDFELLGRDSSAKFEELNYALEQGDKFKNELLAQLEDEKRKVEDLEFQLEEEVLSKGDDDISSISADKEKLLELENALEKEKKKNIQLEQSNQQNSIPQNDTSDLLHLKTSLEQEKLKSSELDDMCKNLKSQIANLSSKDEEIRHLRADGDLMKMHLDEARNKIIHLEMNAKSSNRHSPSKLTEIEKEVATKDGMILQLEASLEQKRKEIVDLQQRISEMDRELDTTKKRNQRQQEIIDNLNVRLASNESSSSNLSDELQELKMHATDLQRKLNASQEKCDNLQHNKVKMEEQLSELMHASGDHSKQFSQLNDMIKMKNNEIEELQSKLQQVTSDLSESNSCSDEMKEKFKIEMSLLEDKLKKEKQVLHEKIKTLDEQLSNTNKKLDDNSLNEDELLKKNAALEMTHLNLKKKEAEVMQLNVKLQESELKADSSSDQLKRVKNELSAIKNDLDGYKNNAESDKESLSSKLMLAETEKERAMLQKDEVEMKLCEMKDRCTDLEKKAALLLKERDEHKHIVDDKEMKLKVLESEVQRLNLEFNSHKAELMEKLKEQQLESGAVSGLSEQLQEYHKQMQELQEDFITCEKQNHDLRADVERLCDIENEKISFQEECERLKAEIKSVTEQENKNLLDFESVKRSLNKQLESSQVQSEQRQKDLEVMQTQINIMQAEKQALCNNNGSKNFEEEKKKLENKVNELQSMVTTYQNEGKSGNFDLAKFQEEKESSEAQIEFLNSVIVDMQKKNDDLTSKVQILETGVSLETNDINLNGIKTAVVAPRLFCDICDRFDLHDTEDCPKQAMSEESPPASQHHADRNQRRPYCEICEMFGHETNECDDVETF